MLFGIVLDLESFDSMDEREIHFPVNSFWDRVPLQYNICENIIVILSLHGVQ